MKEERGNLWEFKKRGHPIAITINGVVKRDSSRLVMGRGCALEAKNRFPDLDLILGDIILRKGYGLIWLYPEQIVFFPTKYHYKEEADLWLIEHSCQELIKLWNHEHTKNERMLEAEKSEGIGSTLYLPRPGCGNGGKDWETEVKPILKRYLDDRFVVITK